MLENISSPNPAPGPTPNKEITLSYFTKYHLSGQILPHPSAEPQLAHV